MSGSHSLKNANGLEYLAIKEKLSSLPLSEEEKAYLALRAYEQRARRTISLRDIIIRIYRERVRLGLSTDTRDIVEAVEGAVTLRYVQMVLKPLRDAERKKLHEKIVELRKKGFTQQKIADEVGLSQPAVAKILSKTGNSTNSNERLERNKQIFALRDQGLTQEQIAKKVGISRQAVAKILAKNATLERNSRVISGSIGCNHNNVSNIQKHKRGGF